MEPAIGGVVKLGPALRTQGEPGHGRLLAVVGDPANDCQPGTAMGAIEERVTITAIVGVEELGAAAVAGGDVGADENRAGRRSLAGFNAELLLTAGGERRGLDRVDLGQGRRAGGELGAELVENAVVAFDFDPDAAGLIADEAAETMAASELVNIRAKTDTLNDPADSNRAAAHRCPPFRRAPESR